MSGERDHSALGASSAHRWMACPGSVAAEAGLPDETSPYAQEGTAAHALAALCLDLKRDAYTWLGETIETVLVTEEMAENVQVYVDYVRDIQAGAEESGIERRFDLASIKPPRPMFGTTDFYAVTPWPQGYQLDIVDLKYGRGHAVSAMRNPQGRYYALGAWIALAERNYAKARQVGMVKIHIVQPRILDGAGEPTITTETMPTATLRLWARQLLEAANRTLLEGAARIAGDHCRWCKAKTLCPEFRSKALAVAQTAFPALEARTVTIPAAHEMTPDQVAAVLEHKDLLEGFLEAVEREALGRLERGQPVPGWARKPKRATRKWVDEDAVKSWAFETAKLSSNEIFVEELKSPAQLEKLVGKGKLPADLTSAISSGYTLCRDTNPRAVAPATTAFPVIPGDEL